MPFWGLRTSYAFLRSRNAKGTQSFLSVPIIRRPVRNLGRLGIQIDHRLSGSIGRVPWHTLSPIPSSNGILYIIAYAFRALPALSFYVPVLTSLAASFSVSWPSGLLSPRVGRDFSPSPFCSISKFQHGNHLLRRICRCRWWCSLCVSISPRVCGFCWSPETGPSPPRPQSFRRWTWIQWIFLVPAVPQPFFVSFSFFVSL